MLYNEKNINTLEDTEMKSFQKYVCVALTAGWVLIPAEMTSATPMIMPGAVDITDANAPEDYFPEIKTVNYYDNYGMPFDDNGSMLGATWFYDADTDLYCKYNNEGELTTQKEYPYIATDMEFGELDIQLSYKRGYALDPEGKEAVLYLMNSDESVYAIRIPCTQNEYVISIPAGEYITYAVQSYDYEDVIIDCPNPPSGCYIPVGETGHLDLQLELNYTYEQLHLKQLPTSSVKFEYERRKASREAASLEEATMESMTLTDANGNLLTTAASSDWITTVPASTSAYDMPSADRTTDSLLDYVAMENEVSEKSDTTTDAVLMALGIGIVVLTIILLVLVVYLITLRKKN